MQSSTPPSYPKSVQSKPSRSGSSHASPGSIIPFPQSEELEEDDSSELEEDSSDEDDSSEDEEDSSEEEEDSSELEEDSSDEEDPHPDA